MTEETNAPHLRVFNFPQIKPYSISNVLKSLTVDHYMVSRNRTHINRVHVAGTPDQPANVIVLSVFEILDRLDPLTNLPTIVLTCFPESLVNAIDGSIESFNTPVHGLNNAIRWCLYEGLNPPSATLSVQRKSPSEHIEHVSPPSFLDRYQTAQCRITPYSLRSAIHKSVIGYLFGAVSQREIRRVMSTSLKFDPIKELIFGESGKNIRAAVAEVKSGKELEEVATRLNLDTFEITFITHSYYKLYNKEKPTQ